MKYRPALTAAAFAALAALFPVRQDSAELRARGEKLFGEGSYELARREFEAAAKLAREPAEQRELAFRVADAQWRALAATAQPDPSGFDAARKALEALVRDVERADQRDRLFAEVNESLGDFYWTRRDLQDWGSAWPRYQQALEHWAASTELELARERYLSIVWKSSVPQGQGWQSFGWIQTPDQVLDDAIAIAESRDDRARAHVLRAVSLSQRGGDWRSLTRVPREFEAALEGGRTQPWYDDALHAYAQWMEQRGRVVRGVNGAWSSVPDFVAALKLYQRLLEEFAQGESQFVNEARERARNITEASLSIFVASTFLPGSEVVASLSWRNVQRVDFALYAVDLVRDARFDNRDESLDLLRGLSLAGKTPSARWSRDTGDRGEHAFGQLEVGVEGTLAEGAYVLEATAGGLRSSEIVLVGNTNALLVTSPSKALVWVTNALTSAPLAEAQVVLFERHNDDSRWNVAKQTGTTRADGALEFALRATDHSELVVCVRRGASQAFARSQRYRNHGGRESWRIQALTDRPAYRPEETLHWKLIARRFDGQRYATPANESIAYTVRDERGAEVGKGIAVLNEFGSAWGELATKADWALGQLQIELRHEQHGGEWIGGAVLCRLEEYKLPEFEVRVETPRDGERLRTYRAGDEVELDVVASYYSGGPVANARAEIVVRQSPFWPGWHRPREFAWYGGEQDAQLRRGGYGGGSVISQQTLTTDAEGKARVRFVTPLEATGDFEYTIEARITDASRREVASSGRVRVARQSYFVHPSARHNLHRVGEPIEIDFKVRDANEQPIAAAGVVRVHRERWFHTWRIADGREIDFEAYEKLSVAERASAVSIDNGYRRELIATHELASNAKGDAFLSFKVEREGAYSIQWSSSDVDGAPIEAATSVWVASDSTRDLGWRRGELEILLDRDEARADEETLVLLSSRRGAGWVLFCVESEELHSWQVIEMSGPTKLVRVPLDERHVPNVFLSAYSVRDGSVVADVERVAVPPVKQFLTVSATPDSALVRPGAEGTWKLVARDWAGKPVRAELSFGVIDESVLAIQGEYALDPRQFFYGDQRQRLLEVASTADLKRFVELMRREDGSLVERRFAGVAGQKELERLSELGYLGKDESDMKLNMRQEGAKAVARERSDGLGAMADSPAPGASYGSGGSEAAVVVRSDFRATAIWQPDVVTDSNGEASVKVRYPQSLTRWKATARAATADSRFGIANGSNATDLPLTVRLQAPRFFVVGDECVISGVIDNHTDGVLTVAVELAAEGLEVLHGPAAALEVPPRGQVRADWHVAARASGEAKLRVTARGRGGDELVSDAMEKSYPVHEHGLEQLIARSGKLDGGSGIVALELPSERKPGSTRLVVRVSPSTATTMLDALPYLIDYPYGCVEQTMSRFLPAAITARTLRELGLDPEVAMSRVFGGVEGEFAAKTHPQGARGLAVLDDVTAKSLQRLYDFQHGDGGWGWWQHGESDRFMSAYVVWGLELARQAGLDVRGEVLERGTRFLSEHLVESENEPDSQAWMLHALALRLDATQRRGDDRFALTAADNLWSKRDRLNAHTRALFALAAKHLGQDERAAALARGLASGASIDRNPDVSLVRRGTQSSAATVQPTAHWGSDGIAWRWSEAPVEATAAVLRALIAIDPKNELVGMAANWLVRNRRGAQWSSTRDTALAVLGLCDYLKSSGELAADFECEVRVNGVSVARRSFEPRTALASPFVVEVDAALVRGANEIEFIRTRGSGALYFAIEARCFNQEEPIRAAGNEIFVRREYFALEPGRTLLRGVVLQRRALRDGESVASGTRIETVVSLEAKNDLEYVLLEDLKPAGLEAVDLTSGELHARELRADALQRRLVAGGEAGAAEDATGRTRWVHRELRDRAVTLFIDRIPQGVWELRYEMRAEVPGTFHALPLVAQAMYVPEIRGNDVELRLVVQ